MDIAGAISAVTAAIGFARELNNVDVQVDQAALKLKIAELTGALADAKLGLVEVADDLRRKDAEINRLATLETDVSKLIFYHGFHMEAFDDGGPKGDPFCPYCIEKKSGLFRIRETRKPGHPSFCPNCKTEYAHAPHHYYEKGG